MASADRNHGELLTGLLKDVSRSFYLTLRVLPHPVRAQIGLAYLLARATDTIADTELVPVEDRLSALEQLRARIAGQSTGPLDFSPLANRCDPSAASQGERFLLLRIEEAISILNAFDDADQGRIRKVLDTITTGQALDLRRFGGKSTSPRSLSTAEELDDYTYRVAGCVGEFWTQMCLAHLFKGAGLDEAALLRDGVRFGKGLQLVNILRDLPRDLRLGRCYLPQEELTAHRLRPEDLLDAANEPRFWPIYERWLDKAQDHLAAGWDYTNTLPRSAIRIRLACAWPLLIGVRTLALLRTRPLLAATEPVKISRSELRRLMINSILTYPFAGPWRHQFDRMARR
jgi:farnesyl-diphosphate farnesyltransferase